MPFGNFNVSSVFVGTCGASVLTVFIPRGVEQRQCQRNAAAAPPAHRGSILRRWCVLRGLVQVKDSWNRNLPDPAKTALPGEPVANPSWHLEFKRRPAVRRQKAGPETPASKPPSGSAARGSRGQTIARTG